MTKAKFDFSELYTAIRALPNEDPRRAPMLGLWHDLSEDDVSDEDNMSRFDAFIDGLSRECGDWFVALVGKRKPPTKPKRARLRPGRTFT